MSISDIYKFKNISISKNQNGRISLNGTFLIGESGLENLKSQDTFTAFGYKFIVLSMSRQQNSPYMTLRAISYTDINKWKINNTLIFQTVSKSVLNSSKYTMINKFEVMELENPDSIILIRTTDNLFLDDASCWTVTSILSEIQKYTNYSFNISVPAMLDYKIINFQAPAGTTITSIISSLLPIPGLSISIQNEDDLHINLPADKNQLEELQTLINNSHCCPYPPTIQNYPFVYIIDGSEGPPKYINYRPTEIEFVNSTQFGLANDPTENYVSLKLIPNKIGSVYGVRSKHITKVNVEENMQMGLIFNNTSTNTSQPQNTTNNQTTNNTTNNQSSNNTPTNQPSNNTR